MLLLQGQGSHGAPGNVQPLYAPRMMSLVVTNPSIGQGKGGMGPFGPCTPTDVHFRNKCDRCKGFGYKKRNHDSSSSSDSD